MKTSISFKAKRNVSMKPVRQKYGWNATTPPKNAFRDGIQNFDSPIQNSRPTHLHSILEEFTSTTTLHGFSFLLNKKYTKIERFWWLVMVICSISMGSYLISKIWSKWNKSPVVLNIADISTSIWQIPFPSITICTETKSRQWVFNFTKAFTERWSHPSTISATDLKLYHDMLLVCRIPEIDGPNFADISSVETLRRVAPTREEIFLKCKWGNYSCDDLFFRTLTRDGYCFTFNMLATDEMFRMENLNNDYVFTESRNKSNWSLENGYGPNSSLYSYPFRGMIQEFDVTLWTDIRDVDRRCCGPVQGFKVWLHNPVELPHLMENFVHLPTEYHSNVMITPRITKTSGNLRYYTSQQRRCYFTDERYLKFFRIYTEKNCEEECTSNYTAQRCDCVPHYMPHGPNTKICGGGKGKCVAKALEELSLAHSQLDVEVNTEGITCGCLQSCTELKYDTEVSQAVFDVEVFETVFNSSIERQWYPVSGLTINFAKDKSIVLLRSELYLTADFLAHCGGIMGLFIGFSILSLIEIIFHFTLRLWCLMRNKQQEDH